MDFIPIFDSIPRENNLIWAVKYPDSELNEFERLMEYWDNAISIDEYLEDNNHHLDSEYWQERSMTQVKMHYKIVGEASALSDSIYDVISSDESIEDKTKHLLEIFKPLVNNEIVPSHKLKAKAPRRDPVLRFYAIITDCKRILITGGGIKLTRTMQECELLKIELQKINRVKDYIKQNNIIDISNC